MIATMLSGCQKSRPATAPDNVTPVVADVPPAETPAKKARKSTAYIEVRPSVKMRHMLLGMAQSSFYRPVSDLLTGMAAGGFGAGSGFGVDYNAETNRTIIVTNRHLVDVGTDTKVSFDGGETMIRGTVLFVSSTDDLATIEITGKVPMLEIAGNDEYEEIEEVFAAGYPSGDYRVTTGTITNRCFDPSKNDANERKGCWVQHTAAIDPGNSGGPLILIKNGRVVGVNTLKSPERESFFLSAPPSTIRDVIAKAQDVRANSHDPVWLTKGLQRSCRMMLAELSSANPNGNNIIPFISDDMVTRYGPVTLASLQNPRLNQIFMRDPILAMRIAVGYALHEQIREIFGGSKPSERCENISASDSEMKPSDTVRIRLSLARKDRESTWTFEKGAWRMSNFEIYQENRLDEDNEEEEEESEEAEE